MPEEATVPHAEYARVKTHLYHRIDSLKARAEAAESALVALTHQHHRTITPGRGHAPQAQGWADCPCLTCRRTAALVPDVAEDWRRCECRARYGLDADGTCPAVATCSHATECAKRRIAAQLSEPFEDHVRTGAVADTGGHEDA